MSELISKYLPNVASLGWTGDSGWGTAIFQTIFMTFWSDLGVNQRRGNLS